MHGNRPSRNMRYPTDLPGAQRGLALITVLLVFAIVTLLATAMIKRQQVDVQRSANNFILQQARAYSFASERLVRSGLYADWDSDKEKDHAKEEWSKPRTFPMGDAKFHITIEDAQGRFNLNSLHPTSANKSLQLQRFRNLLNKLGLDVLLANSVSRWMDKDSQADDTYEAMEPAYRAAYQGCKHVSELLLIEELHDDSYRKLLPYVACLPITATLNVNTADALILATLDSNLTFADGEALVNARGKDGFASIDDFWNQDVLKPYTDPDNNQNQPAGGNNGNAKPKWEKGDFSINTQYFEIFSRVDLGERMATSEALIKRDNSDGRMTTIYRDYSRREAKPKPQNPNATNSANGQLLPIN